MKKLALLLILILAPLARGQGNPFAAYMWNGTAWTPAISTGVSGPVPDGSLAPAAMYCWNTGLSQWVKADSNCFGGGGGGSGTVTSFSAGNLSPLFSTSVATPTTTPALTFTLSNAAANTVFGNFTSGSAAPTFSATPTFAITNLTGTCTACTANAVTGLTIASGKTLTVNNTLTLAGTDSTTMTFPASSATIAGLGIVQTFSAANTFSVAGAASTPGVTISGLPFAGTGTTSIPQLMMGTGAPTTWNTGGTYFGVAPPTGFAGNFLDFHAVNGGASVFLVALSGGVTMAANSSLSIGVGATIGSATPAFKLLNTGLYAWSSTNSTAGATDTTLCRQGAGVVEIGSGTACAASGALQAGLITSGTTTFTVSGCGSAGSVTGNGTVGSFTVGTGTTNCTFTVTVNGATGLTASHGWVANADDTTANIHCVNSTTVSATTAVFVCTGTIATSDLIKFSLASY